jgi:AcrR family transcriptional regulator
VFQRARSQEQRAVRRRAILDTAAAMLAEMPAAQLTLNELSRRVGLAKSNVLRYFESREEVLLELLDTLSRDWLAELAADVAGIVADAPAAAAGGAAAAARGDRLAAAIATSIAARPVLCDLVSAQAAVLEHNVSPQVAAQYKRASIANITTLGGLARECVPELDDHDAARFAAGVFLVAGALWPHSQPSAAILAAYQADPALAAMRPDFAATVREVVEVLISGLLARSSR